MFRETFSVFVEDLFFSPEEQTYWSPEHFALIGWKLNIPTKIGNALVLSKPNTQIKGSVIYFHDGSKNLTAHIPEVAWLCELGLEVYLFDVNHAQREAGKLPIENYVVRSCKIVRQILRDLPADRKTIFFGTFIGAYGALESLSQTTLSPRAVVLHNCPYSFSGYMGAHYGPGLGQLMNLFLNSEKRDPYRIAAENPKIPILVTYQNTGRLPISEFRRFQKTEQRNLSFLEFPMASAGRSVPNEAEKLKRMLTDLLLDSPGQGEEN